jgi:hypothetical protein
MVSQAMKGHGEIQEMPAKLPPKVSFSLKIDSIMAYGDRPVGENGPNSPMESREKTLGEMEARTSSGVFTIGKIAGYCWLMDG